jgi:hypothetical protein
MKFSSVTILGVRQHLSFGRCEWPENSPCGDSVLVTYVSSERIGLT